jgi:cyclase
MAIHKLTTRREMLQASGVLAGASLVGGFLRPNLFARPGHSSLSAAQQAAPQGDRVAEMRAQGSATPLQVAKLRDNLHLLFGPGGNMVVLDGPDGKVLVDSSYAPVAPKIKEAMDNLGNAPLKFVINTHWHLDHTDGNAAMREAGATIMAHENTRKRLSAPQDIKAFGVHFPAAPAQAWPQLTFADAFKLYFNNDALSLGYVPPAHTDTDILIQYENGNVLHMGDVFFNGFYPFIDAGTGGNINGMIAGAARGLSLADADTKIVPGHGPVTDKAGLTKYHDMLATVRGRVQAQKSAGKKLEEVIIAKPTSDFDADWGKGFIPPDGFVTFVYTTL